MGRITGKLVLCIEALLMTSLVGCSAPSSEVLFSSSWENGFDERIKFQTSSRDSIQILRTENQNMPYAIRVEISRGSSYEKVENGTPRAELSFDGIARFTRNREYFVEWQTYIPENYQFDQKQPVVITQIHQGSRFGYPTIALFFSADGKYGIRVRAGKSGDSFGKVFGNPEQDKARVVNWRLHYVPDDTGVYAVTELYKDNHKVFENNGAPNAYANDDESYFKVGLYKADWQKKPSDVNFQTLYYGRISILSTK